MAYSVNTFKIKVTVELIERINGNDCPVATTIVEYPYQLLKI